MTTETTTFNQPTPKQVLGLLFKFGIGIALGDLFCEQLQSWFPTLAFLFDLLSLFIIVFGLTIALVRYKAYFPSFSYGKALWFCLRMGMIIGLVKMIFIILQLNIDPSMLQLMREEGIKAVKSAEGLNKEQVNEVLNSGLLEVIISIPSVAIIIWISTFIQYLFIGLLISIFHRKQSTPFA